MTYEVRRASGRRNSEGNYVHRVLATRTSLPEAEAIYSQEAERLRQGQLILVDESGNVLRSVWAPRLRTRW